MKQNIVWGAALLWFTVEAYRNFTKDTDKFYYSTGLIVGAVLTRLLFG